MKTAPLLLALAFPIFTMGTPTSTDTLVSVNILEINSNFVKASFSVKSGCLKYDILCGMPASVESHIGTPCGAPTIEELVDRWGIEVYGDTTFTWKNLGPKTLHAIYVQPKNMDTTYASLIKILFSTLAEGGTGEATIAVKLTEITETSVRMATTPNTQTSVFHDGLFNRSYYDEIGADSALSITKNNGLPLVDVFDRIMDNLIPNTEYVAIGVGKNANGIWGTATTTSFNTLNAPTNLATCDVAINNITDSSATISINPDEFTKLFVFGIIKEEELDNIGLEQATSNIIATQQQFTNQIADSLWSNLNPGQDYRLVVVARNIYQIWGTPTVGEFKTTGVNGMLNIGINRINIYPNPTCGKFTAELSSNDYDRIVIINTNGQAVAEHRVTGKCATIDATTLPHGIYLLKAIDRNGKPVGYGKIMVQKQ